MMLMLRVSRSTAGILFAIFLITIQATIARAQQKLTLKQAEEAAIQNHPRLKVARLTAEAAGQVPIELRSNLMPNLFTNFTGASALDNSRIAAGGLNNPVIYDRVATGVSVNQLITDFGRTSKLIHSSDLRAASQRQFAEATKAQVMLEVDQAYFGILRAQAVLRVAEQTVNDRRVVLDQVTALSSNKLKSDLDLSFAKVNLADAELLLLNAQNELRAGFAALGEAMGDRSPQEYGLVEEPMPGPLPPKPEDLIAQALRDRPDVNALRLEEDSAVQFRNAERALWLPSISAVSNVGVIPNHSSALSDRYGALGFNITIPVFNGRLYTARRREAELKAGASNERVQEISNTVSRDVTTAWLKASTAFQRIALTAQMLDQAQQALDLAQTRYDLGLSSIVELSQAQLNETATEIASASAKYEYQLQRSVLDYQMGLLR
jgi:outer membrane protein